LAAVALRLVARVIRQPETKYSFWRIDAGSFPEAWRSASMCMPSNAGPAGVALPEADPAALAV
jgi:hypothetical protein